MSSGTRRAVSGSRSRRAVGAPRAFVGRFKGGARADLRWIDTVPSRVGRIIDVGEPAFTQYGLYPY